MRGRGRELGQSEVEDLGAAIRREHDIGRLEVSMGDTRRVRRRHAVAICTAISISRLSGRGPRSITAVRVSR